MGTVVGTILVAVILIAIVAAIIYKLVKDTHCTNDVLLSNKTCNSCNSCLPVAPAKRCEDPADSLTNVSQDTVFHLIFCEHTE